MSYMKLVRGVEFMVYSEAHHQGALGIFWLLSHEIHLFIQSMSYYHTSSVYFDEARAHYGSHERGLPAVIKRMFNASLTHILKYYGPKI